MRRSFFRYVWMAAAVLLMAACSTSRHAEKSSMIGNLKGEEYLERLIENAPRWQAVTGKVAFSLDMGSKGTTSLSATVRMKKGEVIQLSVAPLLGIEVARVEITPDRILAIDRLHKRYVEISFGTLSGMLHTELDFNSLQSLFLNEVFLPGKAWLEADDVRHFRVISEGGHALLVPGLSETVSCSFLTGAESGLLEKTSLGMEGTGYKLEWDYSDFSGLGGKMFPRHMVARVTKSGGAGYSLDMRFSRLSTDSGWSATTDLSSKYSKMNVEDLLKLLLK